ncbi:hypothetical protein, conserved [Eimeria maxima]|uniref:Uncharacterized protein n=1 Tax=Eimeria maxima TaxID=5804 RepID=U6LXX2_EIMMA|nr:hypothetical protein, conserved [Eimeria maxima]CDJ56576.1 hypothetical protein, conserved [Eimeria maxima]
MRSETSAYDADVDLHHAAAGEPQQPVALELRGVDTEMEDVTEYLSTTSDTFSYCENVPEELAHEVDKIRGPLFGGPTTERSSLI